MILIDEYVWAETLNKHIMIKYKISFYEIENDEIKVRVSDEIGGTVPKKDQSKAMKEFIDGRARLFRMRKI